METTISTATEHIPEIPERLRHVFDFYHITDEQRAEHIRALKNLPPEQKETIERIISLT